MAGVIVIVTALIAGGLNFIPIHKASARIVVGRNGDTIIPTMNGNSIITRSSHANPSPNPNASIACHNSPEQSQGHIPPFCGKLIVVKNVQPSGGASPSDFIMHVTGNNPSESSFPGSSSGTTITLGPGSYEVTESSLPGYTASPSTDCSGTIAAGQTKTCIITNTLSLAHLTVAKHVDNTGGGSATASDFTLLVFVDNSQTPIEVPGSESPTTIDINVQNSVRVGEKCTELNCGNNPSYIPQNNCIFNMGPGDSNTCTITNKYDPLSKAGVIKVVKHIADGAGPLAASDFTIHVTGNNPNPQTFQGSESGTQVMVGPGQYSVEETPNTNYIENHNEQCSGTIVAHQFRECDITNFYTGP